MELGVVGASGRMGQSLRQVLLSEKDWNLVFGVARGPLDGFGLHIKDFSNLKISDLTPSGVDVVIDFSLPEISLLAMNWCCENGVPIVSGTTGFNGREKKQIEKMAQRGRILHSPNMSLGIAVLREAMKSLSVLSDFKFEVSEAHHVHKKDSPSGTALMLKEDLQNIAGREVPVQACRQGEVLGEHTVYVRSDQEVLSFKHEATDRSLFARGALRAASWLFAQKKNGLYSLRDMF